MNTPLISVVIPVFNVEKYLKRCADSIIAQSYGNLEIILVDDGSADDCPAICDEYASKDLRVKVIHKKNGGLSSARNAGIDIAQGEYISFVDSDDFIACDMIEQLYLISERSQSDVAVCFMTYDQSELSKGVKGEYELYSAKAALKKIFTEKTFTTSAWGKLYKTELFEDIRFPHGRIYEDWATVYKLIDKAGKLAFVNEKKYFYEYNPQSITKSNFTNKQLDYFSVSDEVLDFVKERYPEYEKYVVDHSVRIAVSFMRKISACGFEDKNTIDFLAGHIRKNIFRYCLSGYSSLSKLYGVYICISPKLALKLFKSR